MRIAAATTSGAARRSPRALFSVIALLTCCATAPAQDSIVPLRLRSLGPGGVRSHLTESNGMLSFALTNSTAEDKELRVLTFYPEAPGRQYGRDLWAPAQATVWSWFCMGGPPSVPDKSITELKSYLYDRTSGREQLVRSPDGPPVHSDLVRFFRREPGTTLMLDVDISDGSPPSSQFSKEGDPQDSEQRSLARANEVRDLVRVFRQRMGWSARVNLVARRLLPPSAEAFDGIEHFVLGSNRIAHDPAGRRALRAWLERGGTLWVLLDLVDADTVAMLLGDALDFQVVDRTSLTSFHLQGGQENAQRVEPRPTEVEDPVDFVRVLVPRQNVLYTANDWPAAFVVDVGRGRVLVTTLGSRGWMRPRTEADGKSRYPEYPKLSVRLAPFDMLMDELHPRSERAALPQEDLRAFVSDQIGYSVVGRDAVLMVFGSLFLLLSVAALALGRIGLLEHLGWLGIALALAAAAIFVELGSLSRGAVPPTVAVAQIVDAVPGVEEFQATGLLGVYSPSQDAAAKGALQGGDFDLDIADLAGRDQRRVQTDLDRWHWEGLELPPGVRTGPFRYTFRPAPSQGNGAGAATARFGPDGLEGLANLGPFQRIEDALLTTPGQHAVAVRLEADGSLRAGPDDELPPGQWLVGGLVSDRQRARQVLYSKLLAEPPPRFLANRHMLLAWAEPVNMHFMLVPEARTVGAALVMVPVQFERTPPGTPVTIPAAFVECRRVAVSGQSFRPAILGRDKSSIRFRFQAPPSVLPLDVERARLSVRLSAVAREVVLNAVVGAELVPLRRVTGPVGSEQIEIDDRRLLRLDENGTLNINVEIGDARATEQDQWRIESLGLEIRGRTLEERRSEHESR